MGLMYSGETDSFGMPLLVEMARLGDLGQYSFWVYHEPLDNPSFHVKHKTDFEIVLQSKDFTILEIKFNKSRHRFTKNELPPTAILDVVKQFMAQTSSKDPGRSNREAFEFAWKLLND